MTERPEYAEDLWWSRDFLVLKEAVRSVNAGSGRHNCKALAAAAGLDWDHGKRAFQALQGNGYLTYHGAQGDTPIWVKTLTRDAYQAVGAYPDASNVADRILDQLENAEQDAPEAEKGKFRQVLDGAQAMGRDVFVRLVGDALSGRLPT